MSVYISSEEMVFLLLIFYYMWMICYLQGLCKEEIQSIKDGPKVAFAMKDLGPTKIILGMNIVRDRKKKLICLSQYDYVSRLLKRFKMDNIKETTTSLAQHFKLSTDQRPKSEGEAAERCRKSHIQISLEA